MPNTMSRARCGSLTVIRICIECEAKYQSEILSLYISCVSIVTERSFIQTGIINLSLIVGLLYFKNWMIISAMI